MKNKCCQINNFEIHTGLKSICSALFVEGKFKTNRNTFSYFALFNGKFDNDSLNLTHVNDVDTKLSYWYAHVIILFEQT